MSELKDDVKKLKDEIRRLKNLNAQLRMENIEQEKALENVKRSEELLLKIGVNMPVMLEAFDAGGRLVIWNRECERVTGFNADEIVGNPDAMKILYPDEKYRTFITEQIELRGQDFRGLEWDVTCKDGSVKTIGWYNVSKHFPISGLKSWAIGVDVTERKRAEEVLRESRERFKQAFDNAALGMALFDPNGRITKPNAYLCRMTGYSEPELTGRSIVDLACQSDNELVRRKIADILEDLTTFAWVESRFVRKDGEHVWALVSFALVRDKRDRPLYFISHLQDISERKRAEKSLRDVNTALQVLLDHREEEKIQLEKNMLSNLEKLVLPFLRNLASTKLDGAQKTYVDIIRSNLSEITSPMAARLTSFDSRLTPTELEVADLIRHGKTTDEIADILNISIPTVSFHRANIRAKLGIKNKRVNLRAYLRSIK